jgi:hypothetical protein
MPNLIGFEKAPELGKFFAKFGVFHDYQVELPEHLLDVLRKQHPDICMENIELLDIPRCDVGGLKDDQHESIVNVQTLSVPMDLRLTLSVGRSRFLLDVRLVLKRDWLGSEPTTTSDMFVRAQAALV